MANLKKVEVRGNAPYNLYECKAVQPHLAFMAGPTTGIEMTWAGKSGEISPNEHGGRTTLYDFVIRGYEAVSWEWLKALTEGIKSVGGEIYCDNTKDVENQ